MNARDEILSAIRAAAVPAAPAAALGSLVPGASAPRTSSELVDLRDTFLRVLSDVGGKGAVRRADQPIEHLLGELPGANHHDAVLIRGRFAVAENAAVYVDADDVPARNAIVLAEHLVVLVPEDAIVPTMHEAVRLMPADSRCGWFLSGPSKTADIEQSLVFGAQGSRTHHVIFSHS